MSIRRVITNTLKIISFSSFQSLSGNSIIAHFTSYRVEDFLEMESSFSFSTPTAVPGLPGNASEVASRKKSFGPGSKSSAEHTFLKAP